MFYNMLPKKYITSIYNTRIHAFGNQKISLVLKEQHTTGTTDEKLPYILESLVKDTASIKILVLEGLGWRASSLDWAENYCSNYSIKLFFSTAVAAKYLEG